MANYNLGRASGSVEIVYDSRGIARTTTDMNRLSDRLEALAHQSATINVNDFEAQRRISELTTQLHELAEERVDPDILLNDEDFRRRFTEIQNQLLELDHDSINPNINIHLSPEELAQLRSLRDNLEELDRQTVDVNVDINSQLARRELEELQAQADHLDGKTINIRAKVDSAGARTLSDLQTTAGLLFGVFTTAAKGAAILELALAALAAIAPIVDVALGGIVALAGGFVAAASGAGLFGAAAVTDLLPVKKAYTDLATAQKQYNAATTDKQRATALQKEQQILAGLNVQQRQLLTSVSTLKQRWTELAQSVSPQVYRVVNNALAGINGLLPKLKPLLGESANAFVTLSQKVNGALGSQATQGWLNFLTRQAPAAILTFGHAAGTLGSALGYTLQAFEPLIGPAERVLSGFVDNIKQKAANLTVSSGFKQFLDFIRGAAPEVGQAIGSLLRAILDLLHSLEPLAKPILGFITDFGHAISTLTKSPGFAIFVKQIGDAFTTLGKALGDNAGGIGTFLGDFGKLVADLFRNLAPLLPHLIGFIDNIARFLDKIVTNPGFPKLVDALGNALDKIGTALANVPPGDITAILNALTGLVNLAGGLLAFGHGAGVAAVALALLLSKMRGGAGAAGGGAGLGLSKLIVPVAVTYAVTGALGLHKQLSDIIGGQFSQALQDSPKWEKTLSVGLSHSLNVATLGLVNVYTPDLSGVFLSGKATAALTLVTATYGKNAAKAFQVALFNEKGDVQKAWDDVYATIKGANPDLFESEGKKAGSFFGLGVQSQTPAAAGAGAALAGAAKNSSIWSGLGNGTNGAIGFWSGLRSQQAATAASANALATQARNGSIWSGLGNGTNGAIGFWFGINTQRGSAGAAAGALAATATSRSLWSGLGEGQGGAIGFWQGINTQRGSAAAAAGALAGTAHSHLFFDGFGAGSSLGNSFAQGLAGAAGAVGAAAGALASAAAAHIRTGSPSKLGVFSGKNGPDALGLRLAMSFAKGMRQGVAAVRSSAAAIAEAAIPGGQASLNTTVGGAAIGAVGRGQQSTSTTTTNRKDVSYAPVFQYVGPLSTDVTKEAQREFDWSLGS